VSGFFLVVVDLLEDWAWGSRKEAKKRKGRKESWIYFKFYLDFSYR